MSTKFKLNTLSNSLDTELAVLAGMDVLETNIVPQSKEQSDALDATWTLFDALTKKEHISYSEISKWLECHHRHLLQYLKQINLESASVHTEFGKVLHELVGYYLETRTIPDNLQEHFNKLDDMLRAINVDPEPEFFHHTIAPILEQVPSWLEKTFPGWEFVDAEHRLYEPIEGTKWQFKGYIDGIIKIPYNGRYKYWIIDWKSCEAFWSPMMEKDFKKQLQLVLYKLFWAAKTGVPLEDISCGFILLRRKVTRNDTSRCKLVEVIVDVKKLQHAKKTIRDMTKRVSKGYFAKNRNSCRWCPYKNTEHCP